MKKLFSGNWQELRNKAIEKSVQYWWAVLIALVAIVAIAINAVSIFHWLASSNAYNNALIVSMAIASIAFLGMCTKAFLHHWRDDTPKWITYTEGDFHGAHWQWKYKDTYEEVDDLRASCLACKHDLKISDGEYPEKILECPSCKKTISRFFGSYDNYQQTIKNLIKQKVRNQYL